MTENKNVDDTNIDFVIKGEHHVQDFSLEKLVNRRDKEVKNKDINAEIQRLKNRLTGDLLKDADIQQEIYALKLILNPQTEFKPELDDDDDCLYCGS